MTNDQPINDVEIEIYDRTVLVTETDTDGIISYANHIFCELSGYALDELIGLPHAVIRHPDMPKQVFENLWVSLHKGETWAGIIKNRTKGGSYYWVKATITPITDNNNKVTGYRSLRRKALPDDIERADALYERIHNGEKVSIPNLHNSHKARGVKGVLNRFIINDYGVVYAVISNLSIAALPLYGFDNTLCMTATALNTALITTAVFYKKSLRRKTIKALENTLHLFLQGNLSSRNKRVYDHEFCQLHDLFNRNAETIEISLSEIDHSLYKLSIGQFDRMTQFSMPGDFGALRNHLNATVISVKNILFLINKRIETLTESKSNTQDSNDINDNFEPTGYYKNIFNNLDYLIQSNQNQMRELIKFVHQAENGDFSSRNVDTDQQSGFISELSTHLNALFKNIEQNLNDISKMAINISSGNLKDPINNTYFGLFGETVDGINSMRQSLSDIIEVMSESINVIHEASLQISNGNMDFAQRTEVQSVNLKKNGVAMEALLAQVKQTADSARLANQLVLETSQVASQGGNSVGEVVNTMVAIDESSRKVASIISVIDEIAFQTNILSLNAAVEAARAGDQGRGFAVVASEVRSLAQRSTAAAKEIKALINVSVVNVENGNAKVEDAGKTINEVVSFVNRVTDLMADITLATSEQSANIDKVNDVIMQIDTITQLNNVLAGESIEAALILEKQSRALRKTIDNYTSSNKDYADDESAHSDETANGLSDASQSGKFELF